jgi:opacity protein-like surface antigen
MKQMAKFLILGVLLLALASPAWAQHFGPYLGIYAGGQLLSPAKGESSSGTFNLEYQPAASGSVVLGWELEPGHRFGEGRVEIEYTHRSNRLDQVEFVEGKVNAAGDLTAESLLVNAFGVYRTASSWTPYFGAGLGVAQLTAKDLTVSNAPLTDDNATVFAYQLGVGTDIALTPSLTLDFGYRLFSTSKATFREASGNEFKSGYLSHSAMVGLRFGF